MSSATSPLPPKPQPPVGYDCCGGGCADCDLRRYQQALAAWQQQAAALGLDVAAASVIYP